MIQGLCINMLFILSATILLYCILNKDKDKRIKISILLVVAYFSIIEIAIITNIYKIFGTLQFVYEVICWGIIINALYENRIKINLNRQEKKILIVAIIFGAISLLILGVSNYKYILPFNKNGEIGNCYFNADVHRGAKELFGFKETINKIHPLYRFILLPITLPIIALNQLLNSIGIDSYSVLMMNGYIATIIQIFLNSLSAVLLYKILKKSKVKDSLCLAGAVLFIFSLSFIWLSIFPETYSITILTTLLMIYKYLEKNKIWMFCGIITIGSNFMSILPVAIILLEILLKSIKKISKQQRNFILLIIFLVILLSAGVVRYFLQYIFNWSDLSISIQEKIRISINKFIIPILLGPNFINIKPFLVQINEPNYLGILLIGILFLIAVIGYFKNAKRNILANICIIQLIAGYVLHVIVGYGINNGIIYASLYSWAFIILTILGLQFILNKNKESLIIPTIIILFIAIYNISWLMNLRDSIVNQKFSTPIETNGEAEIIVELKYSSGETERLFVADREIIQVKTGKKLIDIIDTYVYDEESNIITGTLINSKWFRVYIEDDKLKLDISEKITEITDDEFFILGMGLRDKYLFKKDIESQTYKLIRYSDKKEILNDLLLDKIDYENYTIYVKNKNGENIKIYENQEGIYISNDNNTTTIEDNVKINIPTFDGYNHKKQLRILFNEIMINITKDGPKPNFIAYKHAWYRDAAIIAMTLEKTGNLDQIEEWIKNLDNIYDIQNGTEEADNLGEVLYLISLSNDKNKELIDAILKEANKLKNDEGYIDGITDGGKHPIYQTKWLIYGLKKLGIEYDDWKVPDVYDNYETLTWFDKENDDKKQIYNIGQACPYIYFGYLHYNNIDVELNGATYPISYEYNPSKANFEKLKEIGNDFTNTRLVVPHAWSAAEMFLYLLDLEENL